MTTHCTLISIVHRGDEWHVIKDGASAAECRFKSKADAVEKGRELAMREDTAQLRIATVTGAVQSEVTYGNDPWSVEGSD